MPGKRIYWIIGIVILLAIVAYWMYSKKTTAANPTASAWEKRVAHHMAWLKNAKDQQAMINEKATKNGVTYDQQLRAEAEWYAANEGTPRP